MGPRKVIIFGLAGLFVVALLLFTVTYTVRFTEVAVKTTFGRASDAAEASTPGLRFKLPYPIQSVTKYDTRTRFLQARSETQQTRDNRQIVVEAFCTWRVTDPLLFFQRFGNAGERSADHFREAETVLRSSLRSALALTSQYDITDLFPPDEGPSALEELEEGILRSLRREAIDDGGNVLGQYGMEVVTVGVNRIVLPQETTRAVIERMQVNRERLAQEIDSMGEAEAQTIRSTAQANARRIEEFARRRAQEIRTQGDIEAAEFLAQMDENPDLAVFLKNLEMMREGMAKRTTFVLPVTWPGMELFHPNALDRVPAGTIPRAAFMDAWERDALAGHDGGSGNPGSDNGEDSEANEGSENGSDGGQDGASEDGR